MLQSTLANQSFAYTSIQSSSSAPFDNVALPLASRDSDPNMPDGNGKTLLHHAAISGSLGDVKERLSAGAAVDFRDNDGNQPIHYAALGGFTEIALFLLKSGADVDAKGHGGRTPLHFSIKSLKTVKALLKMHSTVSRQDESGDTALHLAVDASSFDEPPKRTTIATLINSGASVNTHNKAQITPFHTALRKPRSTGLHYTSYVVMFLDNEADIFSPAQDGKLPFQLFLDGAVDSWVNRFPKISPNRRNPDWKLFIAKGANLDVTVKSGELLVIEMLNKCMYYYDTYDRDIELLQLICKGANVNASGTGEYPLHCILRKECFGWGIVDIIKNWLINRGADPNQLNRTGESTLTVCLSQKHFLHSVDVIKMLLDAGANPLQRNGTGQLPIYLAMRGSARDKEAVITILLDPSLWKEAPNRMSPRGQGEPKDQEWWLKYYDLHSHSSWPNQKYLAESANLLPADIAEDLSKRALALLAEKFLEIVKTRFENVDATQGQQKQPIREELVAILRDCQSLKIPVNDTWYRLLLDLQD